MYKPRYNAQLMLWRTWMQLTIQTHKNCKQNVSCPVLKTSLTPLASKGRRDTKYLVLLTGNPSSSGRTQAQPKHIHQLTNHLQYMTSFFLTLAHFLLILQTLQNYHLTRLLNTLLKYRWHRKITSISAVITNAMHAKDEC